MEEKSKMIKIPPIPTREAKFVKGTLTFKILEGCAYCPDQKGFVGGDWVSAHFQTDKGAPVWIKLDGGQLVIEKLENCLRDEKTGNYVGGKAIELLRLNVTE